MKKIEKRKKKDKCSRYKYSSKTKAFFSRSIWKYLTVNKFATNKENKGYFLLCEDNIEDNNCRFQKKQENKVTKK